MRLLRHFVPRNDKKGVPRNDKKKSGASLNDPAIDIDFWGERGIKFTSLDVLDRKIKRSWEIGYGKVF